MMLVALQIITGVSQQDCLRHSSICCLNKINSLTIVNDRLERKFVSPNTVNLSRHNLIKNEIYFLSKGLDIVPTPRGINKALIKEELKAHGRKLRLMWHFHNDEREHSHNPFKKKI